MLKSRDPRVSENGNVVPKRTSAVFYHDDKLQRLGNDLLSLYTASKLPLPQFNRYVFGLFYEITYIEPLLQLKLGPGLSFVGISRVKTLNGLAFRTRFEFSRLQKPKETDSMKILREENERLSQLGLHLNTYDVDLSEYVDAFF